LDAANRQQTSIAAVVAGGTIAEFRVADRLNDTTLEKIEYAIDKMMTKGYRFSSVEPIYAGSRLIKLHTYSIKRGLFRAANHERS
jgi:hypothetical protein